MMPAHYVPLRALRLCCRWIVQNATPQQIPVAVSSPAHVDHGCIVLLTRSAP